jgi:thioredoxin 2
MEQAADTQLINCNSCGAVNRVRKSMVSQDKLPVCGRCKTQLRLVAEPMTITDANFAVLVLQSPQPVLLDAWAVWCQPCRMIAPTIEALAIEFAGRIRVAKLNVDENPAVAARFQIASIPSLLIFNDGREQERLVGVQPKPVIVRALQTYL